MRDRSTSIYAASQEEFMEQTVRIRGQSAGNNRKIRLEELDNEDEGLGCQKMEAKDNEEKMELKENSFLIEGSKKLDFDSCYVEEWKNEEIAEQELFEQLENMNNMYKTTNKYKPEEGIELLCAYFKENIRQMVDCFENDKHLLIHSSVKKPFRSLSNNDLQDINIKEVLDNIIKHYRVENFDQISSVSSHSTCSSNTSSMKEIISQNIDFEQEILKLMVIGNTQVGKTLIINSFMESRSNKYIPSYGLDIKKKIFKIFDKNVRIEFYDTDTNFHLENTSKSKFYF